MNEHLQKAILTLEEANTFFIDYLKDVEIQHKREEQIDNAAHIIAYMKMVYAIMHEMEDE